VARRCEICGEPLEPSISRQFATCPKMHGKLLPALTLPQRKSCELARYKPDAQTGKGKRAVLLIGDAKWLTQGRCLSVPKVIRNRGQRHPKRVSVRDGRFYFVVRVPKDGCE
jgi:hypothetical protein